jgi:diguanylate cyclase (GGDEF)-like protein
LLGTVFATGSPTPSGPAVLRPSHGAGPAPAHRQARRGHVRGFSPATLTSDAGVIISRIVQVIPAWLWVILGGALLVALVGGLAGLLSARRAHRQQISLAAISAAALTDPLTGVLNRRGFVEAAERELARAQRYGRPFAMAYVDIRGLKAVNDSQGHRAGDELLRQAARLLSDSARADDVVGRLGGDELALLLVEQTREGAAVVTSRIRDRLPARRQELGLEAPWDITIGTAAFPEDGDELDQLLGVADRRLYEQRGIILR